MGNSQGRTLFCFGLMGWLSALGCQSSTEPTTEARSTAEVTPSSDAETAAINPNPPDLSESIAISVEEQGEVTGPESDLSREIPDSVEKVTLSEAAWKARLTPQQFRVLRKHGTERPFTNEYCDTKADGIYQCRGCGLELFDSNTKFDSGTGWPSFHAPASDQAIGTTKDNKLFYVRTEVHCSRCGGHLGHVFDDGPAPTGLRYCMNSVSLEFKERKP